MEYQFKQILFLITILGGILLISASQAQLNKAVPENSSIETNAEESDVDRLSSDLDIELMKINSNPDQVNWIIQNLGWEKLHMKKYDFNLWIKVPRDKRILLLEKTFYAFAMERVMLQHNGNEKLNNIIHKLGEGEKLENVVREFQNVYYDIYGDMPSLAFVNSERIKAELLRKY